MCTIVILRLELIANHLSGWQIILYAYGKRGRWIDTLQDFSFKIVHRAKVKHINIDALSRNLVDVANEWED
jgi:hypothetical protein